MTATGPSPRFIIVGLGNPGRIHEDSRHNVGLMAIDALAGGLALFQKEGLSLVRRAQLGATPVLLAKPQTYMGRCGQALKDLLRGHAGEPSRIVVLFDDATLPLGFVRVRSRGSAGGHGGMRAVIQALDDSAIPRVRIGIASEPTTHVSLKMLREDFTDPERERLPAIFRALGAALTLMVEGHIDKAMSLFNRRDVPLDRLPLPAAVTPAAPPPPSSTPETAPPHPVGPVGEERPDREPPPERTKLQAGSGSTKGASDDLGHPPALAAAPCAATRPEPSAAGSAARALSRQPPLDGRSLKDGDALEARQADAWIPCRFARDPETGEERLYLHGEPGKPSLWLVLAPDLELRWPATVPARARARRRPATGAG